MVTRAEENYLKAIYHLGEQGQMSVNTNAIADQLKTKASSVTDMVKKLADKKMVNYIKYKGVSLTDEGQLLAASVIRKHRLWEVFLVDKLGFTWDQVHDIAEQLEHIQSDQLVDHLDAFLGHPTKDPHGEPIPDRNGLIKDNKNIFLSEAEVDQKVTCVGVNDSSTEFLKYLDKHNIGIGTMIEVLAKEPYDLSTTVKINNITIELSEKVTTNIYIN